jgi:hypothetical protein
MVKIRAGRQFGPSLQSASTNRRIGPLEARIPQFLAAEIPLWDCRIKRNGRMVIHLRISSGAESSLPSSTTMISKSVAESCCEIESRQKFRPVQSL